MSSQASPLQECCVCKSRDPSSCISISFFFSLSPRCDCKNSTEKTKLRTSVCFFNTPFFFFNLFSTSPSVKRRPKFYPVLCCRYSSHHSSKPPVISPPSTPRPSVSCRESWVFCGRGVDPFFNKKTIVPTERRRGQTKRIRSLNDGECRSSYLGVVAQRPV